MGKTVAFINMKGGVGKTTLAVNIGYCLSQIFNKSVLLIDADPQMNASQYTLDAKQVKKIIEKPENSILGILKDDYTFPAVVSESKSAKKKSKIKPIHKITDTFHIIPSHLQIIEIPLNEHPNRLRKYIKDEKLNKKYDIIIIDAPPTISAYTKITLIASDYYVVPMKTDYLSVFGLPLLESYIDMLTREFELDLKFGGIMLTMVRPDFTVYRETKKALRKSKRWKDNLFKNEIKYRTSIATALSSDEQEERLPYIIDIKDNELKQNFIDLTSAFMQKVRL